MADEAADWLQDKVMGWIPAPPTNKIDTHHHYVPSFYRNGDASGWPTPSWTPMWSRLLMRRLGVKTAILSVTAPGAFILEGSASFDLARRLNEYGAQLRNEEPQRFGFFASLPSLLDTEAALAEITYALDTLHADGVTLFTRYGSELNRRKCVVFIHPTHPVDTTPGNPLLPQPAIDYPHETTRTAMDMILQGTRRKFPDTKVILSHAGGALPYLITRVATLMRKAPDFVAAHRMGTTHAQVMEDFRSFHFDLALSSTPGVLDLALKMIPHDHILYGSDFPYAPITAYPAFLEDLERYEMSQKLRDRINYVNALQLIPRLRDKSKC
ncbi:uncharacterized protein N7498_000941 [Penicillium cinerascens]|uniref:6-methylsalicylate decarboxylase n=1 Tax=Penicillium cinerascens TaxID=70096 RepID=A0A9W9NFE6_9EURO|nr:uncharacterized protein N7498_000941 [Penicillium cinerascens]KAJ5218842.1 hypothetical protein N7498_000941 [Penicillium cinerascens]